MAKYWFEHLTAETSFYNWYVKWLNYATAVGTGIVAFNKVEIQDTFVGTGIATFKSNVYIDTYKQKIDSYNLDPSVPPQILTILNRTVANFVSTHSTAIWFKFPLDNFHKTTDDRNIKLTYINAGSGSTDVVFDAFYFVGTEDSVLSSTATGTASSKFTINNVTNKLDSDSSLTIPNAAITSTTNWILVKLMRQPGYTEDNSGNFYLLDIEIL